MEVSSNFPSSDLEVSEGHSLKSSIYKNIKSSPISNILEPPQTQFLLDEDEKFSLAKITSAKKALKVLMKAKIIDGREFVVLTGLTPTLVNSLWNLLSMEYPKIRKSSDPRKGILELKVPTWMHEEVHDWLWICREMWNEQNLLTVNEKRDLRMLPSPAVDLRGPAKIAAAPKKEPDTAIISLRAPPSAVGKSPIPSIMVETGYSQGYTSLQENMRRIFWGGSPEIQLVVIVKFTKLAHTVKGRIEFWRRDATGTPVKDEERTIFPAPIIPQPTLSFTRAELFGPAFLFPNRNPNDAFPLDLDELRRSITIFLSHKGLVPA
ncbi:hypothetical protein N7495_007940 [Penicillium taxi]|uniref:uncharacterized protein n=1 Tax=Penicillium taxi TaxID=168475 RepID=UPI0025451CBD|nr:uncharacterized protein N7495_007940 [Penicillium taxi]KAJ5887899.1 hypothetical protein N7495_007940 [Penicillium taxi]